MLIESEFNYPLKKIKIMKIVLGILVVILLFGCKNDNEEDLYPQLVPDCDTANVAYSTVISPIIEANCNLCHSDASKVGGFSLEGYANLSVVAANGSLSKVINHESGMSPMPKGLDQLDTCSINKIDAWINKGSI